MATVSVEDIRTRAKEKKLSLKSLEEKANIANGLIAKWDISIPNLASLQKVADILECNVKDLIKEE